MKGLHAGSADSTGWRLRLPVSWGLAVAPPGVGYFCAPWTDPQPTTRRADLRLLVPAVSAWSAVALLLGYEPAQIVVVALAALLAAVLWPCLVARQSRSETPPRHRVGGALLSPLVAPAGS